MSETGWSATRCLIQTSWLNLLPQMLYMIAYVIHLIEHFMLQYSINHWLIVLHDDVDLDCLAAGCTVCVWGSQFALLSVSQSSLIVAEPEVFVPNQCWINWLCCRGRRISSTGRRDLDRIASQVAGKGRPAKWTCGSQLSKLNYEWHVAYRLSVHCGALCLVFCCKKIVYLLVYRAWCIHILHIR